MKWNKGLCGMKIGLRCVHSSHISSAVWFANFWFGVHHSWLRHVVAVHSNSQWSLTLCSLFSFLLGLDLSCCLFWQVVAVVRRYSTLEVWRGILDCLAKMGMRGLVCCWWSLVEVKIYEEISTIKKKGSFPMQSLCWFLEWIVVK